MKILFLPKKASSPAAMIAAMSIAFLGLAQQAEAVLTWYVTQTGNDVTLDTAGELITGMTTDGVNNGWTDAAHLGIRGQIYSIPDAEFAVAVAGINDPSALFYPWTDTFRAASWSGDVFGSTSGGQLYFSTVSLRPSVLTPDSTMVFEDTDIATIFGTNLDSGPVTLFTALNGGDTIQIGLIPEPSSAALLGLGAIGVLLRRRR
jgi:hypothetical protein